MPGVEGFSASFVSVAPEPAASGVQIGIDLSGTTLPDPDVDGAYYVTIYPTGEGPTDANAEIVLVTSVDVGGHTIERSQFSTGPRTILVGDEVVLGDESLVADPRYPKQFEANGTALDIVDLATEETIYSATIDGGMLATDGCYHLHLHGDYLNNSGSTRGLTIRVKYGATTMIDNVTGTALTNDADRRAWELDVYLNADAANNDQSAFARFRISNSAPTPTAGVGSFGDLGDLGGVTLGNASETSTADKILAVTVEHSTNNASLSFRRKYALLRRIGS